MGNAKVIECPGVRESIRECEWLRLGSRLEQTVAHAITAGRNGVSQNLGPKSTRPYPPINGDRIRVKEGATPAHEDFDCGSRGYSAGGQEPYGQPGKPNPSTGRATGVIGYTLILIFWFFSSYWSWVIRLGSFSRFVIVVNYWIVSIVLWHLPSKDVLKSFRVPLNFCRNCTP